VKEKQIPPLRCGMEMQKGCGMEMQRGAGWKCKKLRMEMQRGVRNGNAGSYGMEMQKGCGMEMQEVEPTARG